MAQEHGEPESRDHAATIDPPGKSKLPSRDAVIEALLELAGERVWEDITISDIAARANLSLADFRDLYPSKGAILGGFARKIDRVVLEGTSDDLLGEPAKERLFDVLMRRLDALAPYKLGIEGIAEWLARAPLAAASVNRLELNSMRFMLEAAGIESEGALGAIKIQGLVLLWGRVLRAWFRDDDPGFATTMAVLDKELTRGAQFASRADDISRLASPLFSLARAFFERRPTGSSPESGDSKKEADEAAKV
ncbi:MAG: TetR/AcrR family transcriptional regulator [Beijerinckiaceae bacterium]|jgi:AcrR family transcriptional regulator